MVVVLFGVELRRVVDVLHGLEEREAGDIHLHLAVVDLAERQQILHDARHAVGLADDDVHKVALQLRRQLVSGVDDRLGVGFDVGQRRAQLVRDIRDKLTLELLAAALLGHVVDDDEHAALRMVGRERGHEQLQLAVAGGLLRFDILRPPQRQEGVQLRFFGEDLVKGRLIRQVPRQHLRGRGVIVDDRPRRIEGDDAVRHVQEQGRELVALVFRLGDGVLQDLCHVVEVLGQIADLIAAVDRDAAGIVARGDALGAHGQRADGRNEDLREQKRQDHADHKTQPQRAQDDGKQLARQRVDRSAVVADVGNVAAVLRDNGHGQIHIVVRDRAALADVAVHGGQDVLGDGDALALVRAVEHAAGFVQNIDVPARNVDAQPRLRHEKLLHLRGRVVLGGELLQLDDKFRGERGLHLLIELGDIEVADAAHQKRAGRQHEGQDQNDHDHDHLHAQRPHGSRLLSA